MLTFLILLLSHFSLSHSSIPSNQISFPFPLSPSNLQACSTLAFQLLPGRVTFDNDNPQDISYRAHSYWATNQAELSPSFRVLPSDSSDLQYAMFIISHLNATFAVRSGGHSVVANTSNIDSGIVIDLRRLSHVSVNVDGGSVDVGAGAKWSDVYSALKDTGFGVVGARTGLVGVGGYLVGGGISSLSTSAGWACDNVLLFEVVLGNGTIIEVDANRHVDLFRMLKGGGINFGIVTRVRLALIRGADNLDVVIVEYAWSRLDRVLKAMTVYNTNAGLDVNASISLSISIEPRSSQPSIQLLITHPRNILNSPALQPLLQIPHTLRLRSHLSQYSLAHLYDNSNPRGHRQHRSTLTIHNSATTLTKITQTLVSRLNETLTGLKASENETDMRAGILIQPLTLPHLHHARQPHHKNILNLDAEQNPLMLLSLELRHDNPINDAKIDTVLDASIADAKRVAMERGMFHAFVYLNYASGSQDVFGFIREGKRELWGEVLRVKALYDCGNVFGRLMRHPFRLEGFYGDVGFGIE